MHTTPYSHRSHAPASPPVPAGYEFTDGPRANAAVDGAGLIAYLTKKRWPKERIKELGEYMIQQCGGSAAENGHSIFDQVRELTISFFAGLLNTESTTFLKSREANYSFLTTLSDGIRRLEFSSKLNKEQTLCISRSLLKETRTHNLESDNKKLSDFSYAVITAICQTKGQDFSIKDFLDQLTPKISIT